MNMFPIRLAALALVALLVAAPSALGQPLPTTSYQGYLEQNGQPVSNPNATLTFRLFRNANGGSPLWTETKTGVAITDGVFNVALGSQTPLVNTLFDGLLFLSTAVGGGGAPQLSPRTVFRSAPYARTLSAPARVTGAAPPYGAVLRVENTASDYGYAVHGLSPATTSDANPVGVFGQAASPFGIGLFGQADHPSGANYGVIGNSYSTAGVGVRGEALATSGFTYGVYGKVASSSGTGVYGAGPGYGVYGESSSNGVFGLGGSSGVRGESLAPYGTGVFGGVIATDGSPVGVFGISLNPIGYAGVFDGRVDVSGTLTKGGGAFQIDHPLDPEGRILRHSFVESPDMMNVYNGNATLDRRGEAVVVLPEWFEALNRDFRYGLTCIGGWAPVYVAERVAGNRFRIAGGTPGLEVSWQVTGIRQDAWAEENRIVVEEDKPQEQRGRYFHPSAFGLPRERGVGYERARMRLEEERAGRPAEASPPRDQ